MFFYSKTFRTLFSYKCKSKCFFSSWKSYIVFFLHLLHASDSLVIELLLGCGLIASAPSVLLLKLSYKFLILFLRLVERCLLCSMDLCLSYFFKGFLRCFLSLFLLLSYFSLISRYLSIFSRNFFIMYPE